MRARFVTVGIAVAAFWAGVGLGCGLPESVPADLIGIWKTDAPRHQDTFLEIRSTSVMLGTGSEALDVLQIEKFEASRDEAGNEVFRFHYDAVEGYRDVLVIKRLRGARGIRVASGEGTWTRSKYR
jgi:hypothetical protein